MSRFVRFRAIPWILLAAMLSVCLPQAVNAANTLKDSTALKFIPADADFFVTGLRQKEQLDKFLNSNAFAKLKSMPMIQMGWFMAKSQWDTPQNPQVAMVKQALEAPANQQLVEMLKDAVANEIFVYGEPGFGQAMAVINELNMASNAGTFEAIAAGDVNDAGKYQFAKILEVLQKQGDKLKVPTSVIGFRLSGAEAATAQIQRLEDLLKAQLAQQPQLASLLKREDVGGTSYLTLRLSGSLIPWQNIAAGSGGADPEQIQKLAELLKDVTITISLGVRDNYLLVSIGDDNKHLADLGGSESLADTSEFAVMEKDADKPIVGISYGSKAMATAVGSINNQMDQMTALARQFIPAAGIGEDLQNELIGDIEAFSEYIKTKVPKPGAVLLYSFMTPAGYESFMHNWAENTTLDASQKLSILNHVGKTPIAFFAARENSSPEDFEQLGKLCQRAAYYIEKIALQQIDDDQQAAYEQLKLKFAPLVDQLATVTKEKLVPAFEDGQGAFVLDAESTSAAWHEQMPPAASELPMLEIGIVAGVSDAGLVKEASTEYFNVLQESLNILHAASTGDLKDAFPEEIPKIDLVAPQQRTVSNGTIYYYTFPAESGLDKQIALNAGLSDDMLILSALPRFTKRLMDGTQLQGTGPLANLDRPLAAAGQFRLAGLIEAIEPWIDYGVGIAMQMGGNAQAGAGMVAQVRDGLEVIKCFRGVAAVTYQEDNRLVTHYEWTFEDLK